MSLIIFSPIPGFSYRIRWNYSDEVSSSYDGLAKDRLQHIRQKMIKTAKGESELDSRTLTADYDFLAERLENLCEDVKKRYKGKNREKLTATLMVFDEQISALRFVAATEVDILKKIFDEPFRPGEGLAGVAFEKRIACFYNESDKTGYYITPSEKTAGNSAASNLMHENFVISIPWLTNDWQLMGVFNVGSHDRNSCLANAWKPTKEAQEEEAKELSLLTMAMGLPIMRRFS